MLSVRADFRIAIHIFSRGVQDAREVLSTHHPEFSHLPCLISAFWGVNKCQIAVEHHCKRTASSVEPAATTAAGCSCPRLTC